MTIIVEEEAITAVVETEVANMVARKATASKGILILIRTSTVLYMKDKGMMQSTIIKWHMTKIKKNKVAMDLNSQIGHINQTLNATT